MPNIFKVWHHIERGLVEKVAASLFLFPILLTFIEVVKRYIFGVTFKWSYEIVVYSFLFSIWLYFSITLAEGGHLRITILSDRMSGRLRKGAEIFADIVGMVFCIVVCWACIVIMPKVFIHRAVSEVAGLPTVIVFLILFISMASSLIRYIEHACKYESSAESGRGK